MPFPAGLTPSTSVDGDLILNGDLVVHGDKNYDTLQVVSGRLIADSDSVIAANRLEVGVAGIIDFVPEVGGSTGTEGGNGGAPGGKGGGGGGGGGGYGAYGNGGGTGSGGTGGQGGNVRPGIDALPLNAPPDAYTRGAAGGAGGAGKDNTLDYGDGSHGAWLGGGSLPAGVRNYTTFTVRSGEVVTATNPSWIKANGYVDLQPGSVVQVTGGDPHAPPFKGGAGAGAINGGGGGGGGHSSVGAVGAAGSAGAGGAGGVAFDNLVGWAQNDINAGQGGAAGGAGAPGGTSGLDLGDGSLGDHVATNATHWLDGQVYNYRNLTIPAGIVALMSGVPQIKVQGDFRLDGELNGSGRGAAGGAGAPGGSGIGVRGSSGGGGGGQGGSSYTDPNGAGNGGGGGGNNGVGGGGAFGGGQGGLGGRSGGAGGPLLRNPGDYPPLAGAGGGGGGAENNGTNQHRGGNGAPGGASPVIRAGRVTGTGQIVSDGGAGEQGVWNAANAYSGSGAGGGGAAGHVRFEATVVQCSIRVYLRGGAGGASPSNVGFGQSAGGPGGGGGGGGFYCLYGQNLGFFAVIDCTAGALGAFTTGSGVNAAYGGANGNAGQSGAAAGAFTPIAGGASGLGGGVLKLTAPIVQNNGTVRARGGDGGPGVQSSGTGGGGAGAGGAAWRQAEGAQGAGAWDVAAGAAGAGTAVAGAGGAAATGRTRNDVVPLTTMGGGTPGPGGAAAKLVFGSALIQGTVRANGGAGVAGATGAGGRGTGGAGGGSGGGLWLAGGALSGGGLLQAVGGVGGAAGGFAGAGGLGGDGRVRLDLNAMLAWTGTISGTQTRNLLPAAAVAMAF